MYHQLYRVTDFQIVDKYTIWVSFDDGSTQTINFEPVLQGVLWGELRNVTLFNQVTIDPIAQTLSWPNGADFDPETLRNWPEYAAELAQRAAQWAEAII